MTVVIQPQPTAPTATARLDTSLQLPIADLSPSQSSPDAHILAQVALVWPYSSSTGTIALLLADPDIRRRKSNGQVKAVFRNGCAKEVAKSKVGIGDTMRLALVGCEWKETGNMVSTPGKKIKWDLEYNARVFLEILRGEKETATVEFTGKEADASTSNGDDIQSKLDGAIDSRSSTIPVPYLTPRKSVGNHLTETFIDAALDSLAEDDGYVLGRGRKRTKFARSSGAWSLVDLEAENHPEEVGKADLDDEDTVRAQSPKAQDVDLAPNPAAFDGRHQTIPQTVTEVSKEAEHQYPRVQTVEENIGDLSGPVSPAEPTPSPIVTEPLVMGPPQTPIRAPALLQSAMNSMDDFDASDSSEAATTPRLLPIPSPSLPLVSPLVHRSGVLIGYFPPLDTSISQLDASSERETETAVPVTDTADLTNGLLPHSHESPVVAADTSPSEKPDESLGANLDAHADAVLASHETQVPSEHPETGGKTAYEAPQWLSSLESTIDRELLLSQDQPAPHNISQHNNRAVDVEDDDLYGAPADAADVDPSFATSPPVGRPSSPLDVLEQFQQISPTTAAGFSVPLKSDDGQNAPNTPQQDASQDMAIKSPQEGIAPSTNSNRSPGRYPEPQSPFRQNRQHQASPVKSTHTLSRQASRSQSLDGHVDRQEIFGEYINHLAQLSAHSKTSRQLVPNAESSHDGFQGETQVETQVLGTTKVDDDAHVKSSEYGLKEIRQITFQATTTDEVNEEPQHPSATSNELKSKSSRMEHIHTHEHFAQLPTPDQSQVQRSLSEPESPKSVRESVEVGFPSPRYTQDDIGGESQQSALPLLQEMTQVADEDLEAVEVASSGTRPAAQAEGADIGQTGQSQQTQKESPAAKGPPAQPAKAGTSPANARPTSVSHFDTLTLHQSSPPFSAEQSTMPANVSSLHFTPSKVTRQHSSSPARKENVNPARDDSAFLSLPMERQIEAPLASAARQEVEKAYLDITSASPDLTANGSELSRGTGIRTSFSYLFHLRSLHTLFGQILDVIAVCTDASSEPEQSKTGRRDFHTALKLADPSIVSETHSPISAQVFRPVRTALPMTRRGDVVILRNFKVQTFNRQFMLMSTDTSSWAVFKPTGGVTMSWSEVAISGPPLEYGATETTLVRLLFRWWNMSGQKLFDVEPAPQTAPLMVENGSPNLHYSSPRFKEEPRPSHQAGPSDDFGNEGDSPETLRSLAAEPEASINDEAANSGDRHEVTPQLANKTDSIPRSGETSNVYLRRSSRRQANETDNFGNDGDGDGVLVDDDWAQNIPLSDRSNRRRGSTISTAPSELGRSFTPRRSARRRKSPSLVHELRDGTRYVDVDRRRSGSLVHELRDGVTYVDE
ncbi:hypothetical protein AYL99_03857 [Fonsecaea erecta]|uniref:Telomeric single stranded DNA binding POT1/Cdc13 domain-containing protein n=1 Tax=Fonsecaea erecta TaxID=1367422 RepID=A0A178ZP96_9EURO|nr:hypothetical protein AYL99_03857 [Fonsecaea erecta]OAP61654.1 hypothetical protein AYL99_03857 [Fonsecaea erecta]